MEKKTHTDGGGNEEGNLRNEPLSNKAEPSSKEGKLVTIQGLGETGHGKKEGSVVARLFSTRRKSVALEY